MNQIIVGDHQAASDFGDDLGTVYISAIKAAATANLVDYHKLHYLGLRAVEAWIEERGRKRAKAEA